MGLSLTGQQIDQSYIGLLKTTDNAAIGATSKVLTDGAGNDLTVSVSTTGMEFTGNIDFTGATVTGAGGAAGLESGTGPESMQSAAALTANPASAGSQRDICLGDGGFTSGGSDNIMIGGAGQASDQSVASANPGLV